MALLYRVRTAITGGPGGGEVNTLFFDATVGTPQDAASAASGFWSAAAAVMHNSFTATTEPTVYTVDDTNGQAVAATSTTSTPHTGSEATDFLPGNVNAVIRAHTGSFIAGRELVGKIWVPGPTEGDNTTGLPSSAYRAILDAATSALVSFTSAQWVVFSRKHQTFAPVTSGTAWNQWGTLRSRRS